MTCDVFHGGLAIYLLLATPFAQHGWTPLFAAACKGHKAVVQYLLNEQHCSTAVTDAVS